MAEYLEDSRVKISSSQRLEGLYAAFDNVIKLAGLAWLKRFVGSPESKATRHMSASRMSNAHSQVMINDRAVSHNPPDS
jgi:hypothetical protein